MYHVKQDSTLIWIKRAAYAGLPAKRITIRVPLGEPYFVGEPPPSIPSFTPQTVGEEAWELVKEWYAARGEPVPEQDRADAAAIIAAEAEEFARIRQGLLPQKRTVAPKATRRAKTPKAAAAAPSSGSGV